VAQIKLTKNELRQLQVRLGQLNKYLPTLKLKKAMLQFEVGLARNESNELQKKSVEAQEKARAAAVLLDLQGYFNPLKAASVEKCQIRRENIAGVEIPMFESISFESHEYTLMDTPIWMESMIMTIRRWREMQARDYVAREKLKALEKELHDVSIRVNLFEKVLIPRAKNSIKRIKIFLGDQELAAVGRAKVAKSKHAGSEKEQIEEVA
jgi:V/A-type H+/Na+-transporting ATPase subunit D